MRIVYSDEAGTGDENDEPVLVVAAFLVHPDGQWPWIEQTRDALLDKYVPAESRERFEFKAARLYRQLSGGNNEPLLREFLEILPKFQLPVFWGALDRKGMKAELKKQGLDAAYSNDLAQQIAFIQAATMVEAFMKFAYPTEQALWVADETHTSMRMSMRATLREHQKRAWLAGLPMTKFDHIMDTVFYGSSVESLGIQLADACNFVIKRHHMGDTSAERFFQIIYPCLARKDYMPPLYSPDDT